MRDSAYWVSMKIKWLVESTNTEIEHLRKTVSSLDDSIPRRTAIRGADGRVSNFSMNSVARERISQAQKERWERVRRSKQTEKGSPQSKKNKEPIFANKLQQLMNEKSPQYWIQDLADALHISFEHARKMVKGLVVPTRIRVEALAQIFDVDAAELIALAEADRFDRKYGASSAGSIFNPEVAPFANAWGVLTDHQKSHLLGQLEGMIAENLARTNATLRDQEARRTQQQFRVVPLGGGIETRHAERSPRFWRGVPPIKSA